MASLFELFWATNICLHAGNWSNIPDLWICGIDAHRPHSRKSQQYSFRITHCWGWNTTSPPADSMYFTYEAGSICRAKSGSPVDLHSNCSAINHFKFNKSSIKWCRHELVFSVLNAWVSHSFTHPRVGKRPHTWMRRRVTCQSTRQYRRRLSFSKISKSPKFSHEWKIVSMTGQSARRTCQSQGSPDMALHQLCSRNIMVTRCLFETHSTKDDAWQPANAQDSQISESDMQIHCQKRPKVHNFTVFRKLVAFTMFASVCFCFGRIWKDGWPPSAARNHDEKRRVSTVALYCPVALQLCTVRT